MTPPNDTPQDENIPEKGHLDAVIKVDGLYENWFLDYASYVILDRAVPNMYDGLKPVQRRILHSLKEMDDGRFNKVANVIGNTMKYHPHGDMAIGDAMVGMGQKVLLMDTQGNWGDPISGDSSAAPRYIEARLSKFANEVVFNPQTTDWQLSYDGRNQEPIILPVKFPLVLTLGTEGIAVGLATKILPHNFLELIDASIGVLRGVRPDLVPDFPTGGSADVAKYNEGQRGGRVRVRATITERDRKTLVITEIPYGTTTVGLIESVISANDKGKIKIKKIEDHTAKNVEILVHLAPGISPDITIDALYAFTNCEMSIAPNTCVIKHDKPHFMSVNDILSESTMHTKELLKLELEIRLAELKERIFFSSLLKIFIQEGMYKHPDYETSGNFERVVEVLDKLFSPFFPQFYRAIVAEDYKRLIDRPMSSITRFDVKKADEQMKSLQDEIDVVTNHLAHLIEYAIDYFEKLRTKYGKGRERKTELRTFDTVHAAQVALANVKLYVNKTEGFVGTSLKKDEFVCDCSDIDDIIAFRSDGKFIVSKVNEKAFMGKDIIHVGVFKKNDDRTVYNMIYRDGTSGVSYMKRFNVGGITRDKENDLTIGTKGTSVLWFSANANGEAESVSIDLKPHSKLKKLKLDIDFAELLVKGRGSKGNVVTKYPIRRVSLKSAGVSTLAGREIWFDPILHRLNAEGRGQFLGSFSGEDKIIAVYQNGSYELSGFDLTNHFDQGILLIEKFDPEMVLSLIHYEGKAKNFFVKRFIPEQSAQGKMVCFISEEPGSKLVIISAHNQPTVALTVLKGKSKEEELTELNLAEFIDVKGLKANGNRLSQHEVLKMELLETPEPEETDEPINEEPSVDDENGEEGEDDGQLGLF